jgi:acetyltransferase-like isoleucine patch superfamily enzyme
MTEELLPDWHHLPANPYNPHAWIIGQPAIGEGCWIGAFTIIDGSGGLVIGDGCEVSAGAQIYTHSTVARVISERKASIQRSPGSNRPSRAHRGGSNSPDGHADRSSLGDWCGSCRARGHHHSALEPGGREPGPDHSRRRPQMDRDPRSERPPGNSRSRCLVTQHFLKAQPR